MAARVDEAGVAGAVPALGRQHFVGRDRVLVVALEQAGRLDQDLAARRHLQLNAFARYADGVSLGLVVGLHADEHRGLGRAVELLQVDADRAVEAEQVGADRFARRVGDANARQPERVAQRAVDAQVAERIERAVAEADRAAVHQRRPGAARDRHEAMEQPALQRAGVFHADHHAGEQSFEDAGRREVVGRPDLFQVDHHRACRLGAVHDVAADEPLRVGKNVLPDPRRRQIGENLLGAAQVVEDRAGARPIGQGEVRVHDAFRIACRARGEEHRGDVVRLGALDLLVEPALLLAHVATARFDQRVERREAGLAVIAQAARVVEPDALQLRARLAQLEHLVDLLLVFDDRERDLGVVHRKCVFGGGSVLIQRHRNGAERLRREHRRRQARPVGADDHDVLPALQPGLRQTGSELAHQVRQLRPGQRLPNAVLLLAQRRRVRSLGGVFEQEAGKGRRHHRLLSKIARRCSVRAVSLGSNRRDEFDAMLSLRRQS